MTVVSRVGLAHRLAAFAASGCCGECAGGESAALIAVKPDPGNIASSTVNRDTRRRRAVGRLGVAVLIDRESGDAPRGHIEHRMNLELAFVGKHFGTVVVPLAIDLDEPAFTRLGVLIIDFACRGPRRHLSIDDCERSTTSPRRGVRDADCDVCESMNRDISTGPSLLEVTGYAWAPEYMALAPALHGLFEVGSTLGVRTQWSHGHRRLGAAAPGRTCGPACPRGFPAFGPPHRSPSLRIHRHR